ncbi:MAG TPA: PQQ-binding-like beta-propeller repeat protein [Terrimicrobiaceae bacterium]|nr:PQQ-binding-like beta-propeller repeat protein [Terrimicrobiaceae bacterium]
MRCAALLLSTLPLLAADWPQWRGPNRDGISPETGLLKSWPAGGPKLVWKTTGLGEGYSSFSVAAGRLYTQGQRSGTQYVMAFDVTTGKKLWEVENGRAYEERRGNGPRGTPTIDGDRLYALAADGSLACLDNKTGKKIWGFNIVTKYSGDVPHWGISESPLIDGARVIVQPGGSGASIVALDKMTGKEIWKSAGDPAAYSSAVLAQVGGIKQLLHFTSQGAVGLRADNGEQLWRYTQVSNRTANIATPIYRNGHAFFSSDYGTGAALLKLDSDPSGKRAQEIYFTREMKNHYSSSVLIGQHLYGFSSSILTAMKFDDGSVAWRDRSVRKGSVISADGMLYAQGENGTIALVEASPTAYKELSRFSITIGGYPLWTLPVIADGHLYLRDQDNLYRYAIK